MEFKVGDRVRYRNIPEITGTVVGVGSPTPNDIAVEFDDKTSGRGTKFTWKGEPHFGWWIEGEKWDLISRPCVQRIHITSDGATTVAVLKDGKDTIRTAEAKCAPDDAYDFMVGARLAFDRLMQDKKCGIDWDAFKDGKIAVHLRDEEEAKEFLKEVEARFPDMRWSSGDKPTEFMPDNYWDKRLCVTCGFSGKNRLGYGRAEFYEPKGRTVVDYTPDKPKDTPKEDKPQFYNGKVVCIAANTPNVTLGKVYEFNNGMSQNDRGYPMPVAGERVTSLDELHAHRYVISRFAPLIESAPTVREVKRAAKQGEFIKIVKAIGAKHKYAAGDIFMVEQIDEDGDVQMIGAAANYIMSCEYVVLEGYQPEVSK